MFAVNKKTGRIALKIAKSPLSHFAEIEFAKKKRKAYV